jgi:lauroyl/myristoyl acyltransferase
MNPREDAPFGRGSLAARLLHAAMVTAIATVGRLPAGPAHGLAAVGSTVEWAVRPRKRRRLAENLCHTLGLPPDHHAVRALVRREVRNEGRRSVDLLWALARPADLLATTKIAGLEHVSAALDHGNGLLLVSPHVGGWEIVTSLAKVFVPVPTTAVVTDDWIAWAVDDLRARAGLGILYDSAPASKAARLLRDGEAVLLLGDYAKDGMRTHPVRLLDAVAELPAGPVSLARLCGTPIVPFSVLPDAPRRWRIQVEPPLWPPARTAGEDGERELLQDLADRFTVTLRRHPEHWAAVYPMTWRPAA